MRCRTARLWRDLQQGDDGRRAALLDQATHRPCGRRIGDFGVAPGELDEAAVQLRQCGPRARSRQLASASSDPAGSSTVASPSLTHAGTVRPPSMATTA